MLLVGWHSLSAGHRSRLIRRSIGSHLPLRHHLGSELRWLRWVAISSGWRSNRRSSGMRVCRILQVLRFASWFGEELMHVHRLLGRRRDGRGGRHVSSRVLNTVGRRRIGGDRAKGLDRICEVATDKRRSGRRRRKQGVWRVYGSESDGSCRESVNETSDGCNRD